MRDKAKKIAIATVCCFVAVICIAVGAALNNLNNKLTLSGISLEYNSKSDSIQTFIDISVKNVDATGVAFCLKYDPTLLALSEADTNKSINPSDTFDREHKYFSQNQTNFPETSGKKVFIDSGILGQADLKNGYLAMNFIPEPESLDTIVAAENSNIGSVEIDGDKFGIIKADNKELSLGTISFKVLNPAELIKALNNDKNSVISIVAYNDVEGIDAPVNSAEDTGVFISYYDENQKLRFYTAGETNINIEVKLKNVELDVPEKTVSALDIYSDGSVNDMISYLNSYMSDLTVTYTDETKTDDVFLWDKNDETYHCDKSWTATGDDYTITQEYNGIEIKAILHVKPVTLTGVYADDEDITYLKGEQLPDTLKKLLPEKIHAIISPASLISCMNDIKISEWKLGTDIINAVPDDFANGNIGEYVFSGKVDVNSLQDENPWLSIKESFKTEAKIDVKRKIVDSKSEMSRKLNVTGRHESNNGMVLTVKYVEMPQETSLPEETLSPEETSSPEETQAPEVTEEPLAVAELSNTESNSGETNDNEIPNNAEFIIRMQNGEILDTSKLSEDKYKVVIDGDTAEISVINLDINDQYQKKIIQEIRLGKRLGTFGVAMKKSDGSQTEFAEFTLDPYQNSYKEKKYSFDYSTNSALMMPVKRDESGNLLLSSIIKLPGTDRVTTVYDGYTGDDNGQLKTVKVDSWKEIESKNGIVTVEGMLADTGYSNYGEVKNNISSKISLKLKLQETGDQSIDELQDFEFNMRKKGYDILQTADFTIKNSGNCDIKGLSVEIGLDEGGKECFSLVNPTQSILQENQSATFSIRTKKGLDVGRHIAMVTVSSNQRELGSFRITFEVTNNDIYSITLKSSDDKMGKAETETKQYTAVAGSTVNVVAIPAEDCEFVSWSETSENKVLNLEDGTVTDKEYSFTMPHADVELTANFRETSMAYLRLDELCVIGDDKTYDLCDSDFKQVQYSPNVIEYCAVLPNDVTDAKLKFKPRAEGKDATIKVEYSVVDPNDGNKKSGTKDVEFTKNSDETYTTNDKSFELILSPKYNEITISMTFGGEPKKYTVKIYKKLAIKDMIKFEYGNSPYGLIDRMSEISEPWNAEKIKTAKEKFIENEKIYKFADGYIPVGGNKAVNYLTKAWDTENLDISSSALFVIQNNNENNTERLIDPGWKSLVNSIGKNVAIKDVSRKMTIKSLTEESIEEWGTVQDFAKQTSEEIIFTSDNDTKSECDISELLNSRIYPGIYEITYTFKDYDGKDLLITKKVVILPMLGDITLDKALDGTDSRKIIERFKTMLPEIESNALYKYRVCDINKDGNINAIDANTNTNKQTIPFYSNIK